MNEICSDKRFEIIEKVKNQLIECTNITQKELEVLDTILFRLWQLKYFDNGVVWHDLRKNPGDLPKERGEYLVAFKLPKGWDTTILMYNNDEYEDEDELCWFDSEYTNYNDEVIAWCEIPKFKE